MGPVFQDKRGSPRPSAAAWAVGLVLLGLAAVEAAPPASQPAPSVLLWDGPKLTPTNRQEVFEFTAEPTFGPLRDNNGKMLPDRYVIRFAAKANCDVCVDVLDGGGKVVRYLAYGVFGPNAPAPLEPNRLNQAIVWDGKDESGRYVQDAANCSARVRLGLVPKWDKVLGWHPKNVNSINNPRNVGAIAADPDGVYVLLSGIGAQLRAYGHDGRYLRTLVPLRADRIEEFKQADLTDVIQLPDGTTHYYPGSGPGEGSGPRGWHFGNHFLPKGFQRMATAAGKIALAGGGGALTPRRIVRIRNDGSLDNGRFYGSYLNSMEAQWTSRGDAPRVIDGANALAASPDGRWLYVSGFLGVYQSIGSSTMEKAKAAAVTGTGFSNRLGGQPVHAVYRFAWDGADPGLGDSFVGEPRKAGADEKHLDSPTDLAADADGNLYVADQGNNRIQVFSPDARLLRSIPIKNPYAIDIDRRTGCVYVLSIDEVAGKRETVMTWRMRLVKFDRDGRQRIAQPFDYRDSAATSWEYSGSPPVFCVDGWADVPTVWLTHRGGQIARYADRGDRFELIGEFVKEVRDAGEATFFVGLSAGDYPHLKADPVRPHVYLVRNGEPPARFDIDSGRFEHPAGFPKLGGALDDIAFGPQGLAYVRTSGFLVRLDPKDWHEVPLDYGEPVGEGFTGGIRFPWPPSPHWQGGLDVTPTGDILAMGMFGTSVITANLSGRWTPPSTRLQMTSEELANFYVPALYMGRPAGHLDANLVCVWDAQGQPKLLDAVKGVSKSSTGLCGDREGNIYVGCAAAKYGPDGKLIYGNAVTKFGPAGGKFLCAAQARVPLGELPDRPAELNAWGVDLWTQGLLWSCGGVNAMVGPGAGCICPHVRFDVDRYGRLFVTEAHRNSVAVLDTNGNFVLRLGRYGNADSGRGPESPIRIGGDEIAVAYCTFVSSDGKGDWLYLADNGNDRIVRVKLDYHRQALAKISDE